MSQNLNWPKIRNAIRKGLRRRQVDRDLDDYMQEACVFAWDLIGDGIDVGIAIHRAIGLALSGHQVAAEIIETSNWEDCPDMTRPLSGAGAYSRRAAAGLPMRETADDDPGRCYIAGHHGDTIGNIKSLWVSTNNILDVVCMLD